MMNGRYLLIDGPDGCGKTTLINQLKKDFPHFVYVKEPGDERFELTTQIRHYFLHNTEPIPDISRMYLMLADRIKLQEYINSQLALGKTVISDRSFCSTLAYQTNVQENLTMDTILTAHVPYFTHFHPDAIVLLNLDSKTRQQRMIARNEPLDTIELKGDSFFELVAQRYATLKKEFINLDYLNLANKVHYLDASQDVHSVYQTFVAKFL